MASSNEAKVGLELDKIELSTTARAPVRESSGYRGIQKETDTKTAINKRSLLTILFLISGVFFFFSVILFLWDQGVVDVPLLASKKIQRELERYATVGPLMTSIGKDQHIKLTLTIECRNAGSKERIAEIDSAIKSKILMTLNTPEAKGILSRKDYQALKPYFKKAISKLVEKNAIKDIHFSDIIRY